MLSVLVVAITVSARQQALQSAPCPSDWYTSTDQQVLERCAQAKEATSEAVARTDAIQAALNPTPPPIQVILTPTPPGYIASAMTIHALNPAEFIDGAFNIRGSNSIWLIGKVSTNNPLIFGHLYALTRLPKDGLYASLAVTSDGDVMSEAAFALYDKFWVAPQDVGIITITNVTGSTISPSGPTGIIYFTTQSGKTGHLTIATGAWTFDP